jgi:hypothetical protein
MVDRRPRMRRSHRNATVLIFTWLIQRSDGSHVSNWILVIRYLGFSYKQPPWPSPSWSFLPSATSPFLFLPLGKKLAGSSLCPAAARRRRRWGRPTVHFASMYCNSVTVRAVTYLIRFEGFSDLIWVGNQNKNYISFQYLSREYLFTNFGWVFWELWLLEFRCQLWLVLEFS